MYRLRSKSGDESVFRTAEEIRAALLSGFVTPDAQIWDTALKGWVPLLEHSLYKEIASAPGGRKSGPVQAPPAPKVPPKLVIRRPAEGAPPPPPEPTVPPEAATPAPKPEPAPPAAPELVPDLELIDLPPAEPAEAPRTPPPTPAPPPAPAAPAAKAPAPPPPPPEEPVEPAPAPRTSRPEPAPAPMGYLADQGAERGSRRGLLIGAIVLVAAGAGAFALLRGRGAATPGADSAATDTTLPGVIAAAPVADSAHPDSAQAGADSATTDSAAAAPSDTIRSAVSLAAAATPPAPADSAAAGAVAPVSFAPLVPGGMTPWAIDPAPGPALSLPAVEALRQSYLAAQARALAQFEAGLQAVGFTDMFDPARAGRPERRAESVDAVDGARSQLREFRRRQVAIDFAYTDSLRQTLPPEAGDPDLRTFGRLLRESPAQQAVTDSLVGGVGEMFGLLVSEAGSFTLRAGMLQFQDADAAQRYQGLVERLTAEIGRLRATPGVQIPPATAVVLRGIGLPR
ncbi:MAG TPA: hypothetical protein VFS07_04065 [Gemmatimonadales bacterium]|nr:hypothetical protein [Gemmatimonadales bacterium]